LLTEKKVADSEKNVTDSEKKVADFSNGAILQRYLSRPPYIQVVDKVADPAQKEYLKKVKMISNSGTEVKPEPQTRQYITLNQTSTY
jgi:hypothetical protein